MMPIISVVDNTDAYICDFCEKKFTVHVRCDMLILGEIYHLCPMCHIEFGRIVQESLK